MTTNAKQYKPPTELRHDYPCPCAVFRKPIPITNDSNMKNHFIRVAWDNGKYTQDFVVHTNSICDANRLIMSKLSDREEMVYSTLEGFIPEDEVIGEIVFMSPPRLASDTENEEKDIRDILEQAKNEGYDCSGFFKEYESNSNSIQNQHRKDEKI